MGCVEDSVSLFGKMVPYKPDMEIPQEVKVLLEESGKKDAGLHPVHYSSYDGLIKWLYEDLEVFMFFEILTHLPGKHLNAFITMNDQNRSRMELAA
jgi:hypothetical protein